MLSWEATTCPSSDTGLWWGGDSRVAMCHSQVVGAHQLKGTNSPMVPTRSQEMRYDDGTKTTVALGADRLGLRRQTVSCV